MGFIGVHVSIAGGIYNAVSEGVRTGCEAIQIFTANQRTWDVKSPSNADVNKFIEDFKNSGLKKAVAHDSYLINLASTDSAKLAQSRNAFYEEMERVQALKLDGLVFHPGSYRGGTLEQGLDTVAESMNLALSRVKKFNSKLLLEITAGTGNTIGGSFEEVAYILDKIKDKEKTGICFDTAHAYGAGYDLKNEYEKIFKKIDSVIGLERLLCFHANDSMVPLGSKKDRHQHLGQGEIGIEFFRKLINDKRFKNTPVIMETPDENDMDIKNIKLMKSLRKK